MSDLTNFLLARIADDEAAAERAVIFRTKNGMAWIGPTPETATMLAMSGHRLFAQCVALPYADHPDFQREWTPS